MGKDAPEYAEAAQAAQEVLSRMQARLEITPAEEFVPPVVQAVADAPAAATSGGLTAEMVLPKLLEVVKSVVAEDDDIDQDTPFMDAGVDSLSSVQLVGELSREFK